MTWIETGRPSPENAALAAALEAGTAGYPAEYGGREDELRVPAPVREDSIVLAHSIAPDVLRHVFAGYRALLDPGLPLARRQHEMIATLVSAKNRCFY